MEKKITKKAFKELCNFHVYTSMSGGGKTNVIYYDYKTDFTDNKRIAGYKFAVAGQIENINKKELFNELYDWVVKEETPIFYVRYKFARTDDERFKIPLSLNF